MTKAEQQLFNEMKGLLAKASGGIVKAPAKERVPVTLKDTGLTQAEVDRVVSAIRQQLRAKIDAKVVSKGSGRVQMGLHTVIDKVNRSIRKAFPQLSDEQVWHLQDYIDQTTDLVKVPTTNPPGANFFFAENAPKRNESGTFAI